MVEQYTSYVTYIVSSCLLGMCWVNSLRYQIIALSVTGKETLILRDFSQH